MLFIVHFSIHFLCVLVLPRCYVVCAALQFVPCSCLLPEVYNYILFNWTLLNCMKREMPILNNKNFLDILSLNTWTTWIARENFCVFVCPKIIFRWVPKWTDLTEPFFLTKRCILYIYTYSCMGINYHLLKFFHINFPGNNVCIKKAPSHQNTNKLGTDWKFKPDWINWPDVWTKIVEQYVQSDQT